MNSKVNSFEELKVDVSDLPTLKTVVVTKPERIPFTILSDLPSGIHPVFRQEYTRKIIDKNEKDNHD